MRRFQTSAQLYPEGVPLADELERAAVFAAAHAEPGETVDGVVAAEPALGRRVYLCAFGRADPDGRAWLALDEAGAPVVDRRLVRETVSIAALCELAAETAGGGDLDALRARLLDLRLRERPPGIEEVEEAALELERTIGGEPRVATPAYLDAVGVATRRLESALGEDGGSPFAAAMQTGMGSVEALTLEVERRYKCNLR
jgi:hypothetical protein